jgi:hypothetical protein
MIFSALLAVALAAAAAEPSPAVQPDPLAALQKSCDAGKADGCHQLAEALWSAEGPLRDRRRACSAEGTACTKGAKEACERAWECAIGGDYADRDLPRALALLKRGCELEHKISCEMLDFYRESGTKDPVQVEADLDLVGTEDEPAFAIGAERIVADDGTASCGKLAKKRLSFRMDFFRPWKTLYAALGKLRACGVEEAGPVILWHVEPREPIWLSLRGPAPRTSLLVLPDASAVVLRAGEVASLDPALTSEQLLALGQDGEPVAVDSLDTISSYVLLGAADRVRRGKDGKKTPPRVVFGTDGLTPENLATGFAVRQYGLPNPPSESAKPAQLAGLRRIFGHSDLLRTTEVKVPRWTQQKSGFCLLEKEGKKLPVAFGVGYSASNNTRLRQSGADAKGRQAIAALLEPLIDSGALKDPHAVKRGGTITLQGAYLGAEQEFVARLRWSLMVMEDLPIEKLAKEPCAMGEQTLRLAVVAGPADERGQPIGPPGLDVFSPAKGGSERTPGSMAFWRLQPLDTADAAAEKFARDELVDYLADNFKSLSEDANAEVGACFKALDAKALTAPAKAQLVSDHLTSRKAAVLTVDVKALEASLPPPCASKAAKAKLAELLE